MAQVRDVRMRTMRGNDQQQYAEVNFAVEFSRSEMEMDMNFGMYVMLMAAQGPHGQHGWPGMQGQGWNPNGAFEMQRPPMNQHPMNNWMPHNSHGPVIWVAREWINARQCKSQYFTRRCSFPQNSMISQAPGYFANVSIIPEISEGRGWSNLCRFGQQQGHFQEESFQQGMPYGQQMNWGQQPNYGSQPSQEQVFSPGMVYSN